MKRLPDFSNTSKGYSAFFFRGKDEMRKKQRATFYCEVVDVIHAAIKRKMNLNNPNGQRTESVISYF